jgi:hypothetical protein
MNNNQVLKLYLFDIYINSKMSLKISMKIKQMNKKIIVIRTLCNKYILKTKVNKVKNLMLKTIMLYRNLIL